MDFGELMPKDPLGWIYFLGALASICIAAFHIWKWLRRRALEALAHFSAGAAAAVADIRLDTVEKALDLSMSQTSMIGYCTEQIARMIGMSAILIYLGYLIPDYFVLLVISLGPLFIILSASGKLFRILHAQKDYVSYLEQTASELDKWLGRIPEDDPKLTKLRAGLVETKTQIEALVEKRRNQEAENHSAPQIKLTSETDGVPNT